jgi:hypothetical protein
MAKKKFGIYIPADVDYDAILRVVKYPGGDAWLKDSYDETVKDQKQIYRIRNRFEQSQVKETKMGTVRHVKLTKGEVSFFGKMMCERLQKADLKVESATSSKQRHELMIAQAKEGKHLGHRQSAWPEELEKIEKQLSFAEYEQRLCNSIMHKVFGDKATAIFEANKVISKGLQMQDDLQVATGKAAFAEHVESVLQRDEGELD